MKRARLLPPALALVVAPLVGLAGCEQIDPDGVQPGSQKAGSNPDAPLFDLVPDAPWTTRYSGIRVFETHFELPDGQIEDLAYREQVFSDGQGEIAIDVLDVLTYVEPTEEIYKMLQKVREGFHYSHRDFRIRDLDLFFANYQATDLQSDVVVAGRAAREFLVEKQAGGDSSTTVAFDVETGLVLRYEERSLAGVLLAKMEFESYDADPDLTQVVWYPSPHEETALDVTADLSEQLGFDALLPGVLPDGFALWKASTLIDPDQRTWLKLTYTDGAEPLFFLHSGIVPSTTSTVTPPVVSGQGDAMKRAEDFVVVYPLGPATAVQGIVRGEEFIAVGNSSDDDLLDMVESAIP